MIEVKLFKKFYSEWLYFLTDWVHGTKSKNYLGFVFSPS